ncbi:Rpn family recombination-promoting nuclease/putative transposase [Treponema sp.]|uniref:Rpn family recombination-promoting nuclease/putative transposase n=1 Tax=Treponema sp. TaxID=166 RepID=UPI00298E58F2|nr:Rpn family recombination-promoting nuclease/putative transposase [Treponema sp.]MCR5613297.1 Rpn family recombination-promoting nuclease/putative transposase [Treponema sp.]
MTKRFEDLTFADDGMFQAVLRDPAICAEFVELLLGVSVEHVEYPELEKVIEPFYTTKGVRLDVYLKDEDRVIDVELQSYNLTELGKRMRYYEAMVDIDSLLKGQPYDKLKESYILFICKFDPFVDKDGKPFGLPCYSFRNICKENAAVNLNDKSHKVVYNASAYESEKNERIKALLRYIQTDESGEDDFSKRLDTLVSRMKENEKFKREYMLMNLHDYDILRKGREEGLAAGSQQKAIEDAVMLVKDFNVDPKVAAEKTGAPLDKVLKAVS